MRILTNMFFAAFLLFSTQAFGHAAYEHNVGSFVRSDGAVVSVVQHFEDGIFFDDPMTVHFRLPDRKTFAKTGPFTCDVVVRTTASTAEIYLFENRWVPIANTVQQYDGYSFREVTEIKQNISLLLHTAHYSRAYIIDLGVVAVLLLIWLGVQSVPQRGHFKVVRIIAFVCIAFVGVIWGVVLLFVADSSPLVLVLLASVCAVLYMLIYRVYHYAVAA